MSLSEAAQHFHAGDYTQAAEILKKTLYNATPNVEHNAAICDYYTKPNPRSQSKSLLKQLTNLQSSYPQQISKRSALLFNEAELHLNRHQYSKAVEIFKSLTNSHDDNVPINIYFRSCLRLFSIYLHHDMIDNAKLIHSKLTTMKTEDIKSLDISSDPTVSSLKHSYWCHIIGCHLKLIESSSLSSTSINGATTTNLITPIQEAYKELTAAIDLVKKGKNGDEEEWHINYKIRILFLKAHQDFISGNVNTAKSQLFATKKNILHSNMDMIGFLNNMSCIYAINDEPGSAMSLIHRALSLHASFMDKSPLYSADHMISYLCYNAGLYLQNLQQYHRAIDSFLCCLPVLQSKPRLWLRMAQCILSIWEPFGGFENNKDGQPQINSLVHNIIEADSTKRGDLYLLPIGRKPVIYNININDQEQEQKQKQHQELNHILKWHERKDNEYSFPYNLYKKKQNDKEIKRKKRWIKRKEKQKEFCLKTDAIINELDNGDTLKKEQCVEQERINKKYREKRLYEKEKLNKLQQEKNDSEEYKLQIGELNDLKLAIEWLKNAISLFKKMETKLYIFDYIGHISAHLHISYCYLKLKAWNFAHRHAELTINMYQKQQTAKQKKPIISTTNPQSFQQQQIPSSHTTYLAHSYAAEALIHLRKFNEAIKHLNPSNCPHLVFQKEAINKKENNKKRIENNNNYLAILVNLATTYICKDGLDKAHKYIYKALQLNDEYYPALRMLIYLHIRMGNNNEAIKILKYRRPIPVKQLMQGNDNLY